VSGACTIDGGVWHLSDWGEASATYDVRLANNATPQPVVVRIEASTLANAGLPDEGFDAIEAAVDRHARDAIDRLAATGRVSPEIVITPEQLAGLEGLDLHPPS
jgi:hypothetical protein